MHHQCVTVVICVSDGSHSYSGEIKFLVLVGISLVLEAAEYFSMCFLAICVSFESFLFSSIAQSLIGLLIILMFSVLVLYVNSSVSGEFLAKILSGFVGCVLTCFTVPFAAQKILVS